MYIFLCVWKSKLTTHSLSSITTYLSVSTDVLTILKRVQCNCLFYMIMNNCFGQRLFSENILTKCNICFSRIVPASEIIRKSNDGEDN